MSTEVTPESLRAHAAFLRSRGVVEFEVVIWDRWADRLEHEQRPLPTVPGWYQVVVERGGESCTGALLTENGVWVTALPVDYSNCHDSDDRAVTIRWAEQDGTTPGQTLWEAQERRVAAWRFASPEVQGEWESMAAAVLAAHGTPTLTDEDRSVVYRRGWDAGCRAGLDPVGEHPEPGTRGLLPVEVGSEGDGWLYNLGQNYLCSLSSRRSEAILADPRPDGAHE